MKYLIILEETETGYSAYSPDIQGCVAAGRTREEVEQLMHDAVALHLEELYASGIEAPKPVSSSAYVEVPA